MFGPEPFGEFADDEMIRPRLGIWFNRLARELQEGVAAAGVDVVMLQECRGGQNDVRHYRGFGQELLVYADKQIGAVESFPYLQ